MKHESELIAAAHEGFRKWLTTEEVKQYVEDERKRVQKAPELFLIAFNTSKGFVKVDVSIAKMTKLVDETGKMIDLELHVVNDDVSEPTKMMTSVFQPGAHPQIQFCRIFKVAKDRDSYYEDIRYLADLSSDYKQSLIALMRKQMGF